MLDLVGSAFRGRDRLGRRDILRVGTLAAGGLSLPDFLGGRVLAGGRDGGATAGRTRPTAVIQIFMGGGPSHIDMYDLKPDAPTEIRGEFREIPTSVPGIRISEHLPLQARVMDRLAIVRSVTHTNPSHLPSSHLVLTGYEPSAPPKDNLNPFAGAVVSKLRGPNASGLPAYVAVSRRVSYGAPAYLGVAHGPFATTRDPNADDFFVPDMKPLSDIPVDRLGSREKLLREFDRIRRDTDLGGDMRGMDTYFREAVELITGERAVRAFDIEQEDPRIRDKYGRTQIGQNCLLARRLVEAGVTYVTCLSGGGWDTHKSNFSELRTLSLPRYDRAVAALVSDIYDRGLDGHVLVMAFGEFGRTPTINRDAGRDHWPGAACVLFSGGGVKVGQMIGSTDSRGAFPTSRPYSPGCVLATMYGTMGIDSHRTFSDHNGRPLAVLPEGQPIREL